MMHGKGRGGWMRVGLGATALLTLMTTIWTASAAAQAPAPAPGTPAPAAAPAPAAPHGVGINPTTGELPPLIELFNTSPIINGIIAGLSVLALLLFLYFFVTINTGTLAPAAFVDDVNKLVLAGKYDEAASLCRSHRRVFVASVIQRCVENAGKGHSVIMDMLDAEGRRRADIIWNRVSYLADISNVAPMFGLLGTVVGMIRAFFGMHFESLSVESKALTNAIGGAMSTTMFGLIVAIVALFFYSVVKARATKALGSAEQIVHSIADHVKRGAA